MEPLENIGEESQKYLNIIHLDRLEITLKQGNNSAFRNYRNPDLIQEKQNYGLFSLYLDNTIGAAAYYHTYIVHYKGNKVGKLHSANKMRKPEVEFDFDKTVLYSVNGKWWHEILTSLQAELGLEYNNIKYAEIALDTSKNLVEAFRGLYDKTVDNKSCHHKDYRLQRNSKVDILDNGTTFNIRGKCNMISIYEKSSYAEDYIKEFFKLNGFGDSPVYRVEARLNWNYLKSKMSYKQVRINLETLLDTKMLTTLFKMSVENKLAFSDLRSKQYDKNRNLVSAKVSILDDITIESGNLIKYIPVSSKFHYKSQSIDENIIRQSYYRYLETNNAEYLEIVKANCKIIGLSSSQLQSLINKFNARYKGDRTEEIQTRMESTKDGLTKNSFMNSTKAKLLELKHRILRKLRSNK